MSDLQALYLILVALYLIQCIVWVPEDSYVFRKNLRGEWRRVTGALHIGAWRLRGTFASPLPPLHGLIVCDRLPLAVSPAGVLLASDVRAAAGPAESPTFLRWDHLNKVTAHGKEVLAGNKRLLKAQTACVARRAAVLLERLRTKKPEKRAALLDAECSRALDTTAIRARLDACLAQSSLLRWQCNVLFFYLFVAAPAVITLRGLRGEWLWLLALLLAQMAAIAWLFRRAHRALLPDDADERFSAILTIALSPPVAIRADDILLRELLSAFHPLAVARVCCKETYFVEFAARRLRELAFPLPSATPAGTLAQETESLYREAQLRWIERFLSECGVDPREFLAPPPRESPQALAYCPRCCVQFVVAEGDCPDCGVALRAFAPDTKALAE